MVRDSSTNILLVEASFLIVVIVPDEGQGIESEQVQPEPPFQVVHCDHSLVLLHLVLFILEWLSEHP